MWSGRSGHNICCQLGKFRESTSVRAATRSLGREEEGDNDDSDDDGDDHKDDDDNGNNKKIRC